jgi:hypothetical protein
VSTEVKHAERLVTVFCQNTAAAEDLMAALDMVRERPWAPNPPGTPFGAPQERYTQEETDAAILAFLKRAAEAGYALTGSVLIP